MSTLDPELEVAAHSVPRARTDAHNVLSKSMKQYPCNVIYLANMTAEDGSEMTRRNQVWTHCAPLAANRFDFHR
jgi:hypothetical protein